MPHYFKGKQLQKGGTFKVCPVYYDSQKDAKTGCVNPT